MNRQTLTVFTPTYNRADLLSRGYEALLRQTSKDFKWVIIDDGSKDNTRELVESWVAEGKMPIKYYYKENGGLHTSYNKAIEVMDTEICVCIDSDDYMPDDGVEIITEYWAKHRHENIAGFVGLDYTINGKMLGNLFPEDKVLHYVNLKENPKYQEDNKVVMRVDLLKKVAPQPSFPGEKNFNPIWMMLKIDQLAPFRMINKNLCFVDYQPTGMSANIINQYFNSPKSFLELRKLYISLKYTSMKWKIRQYIHLVASAKIAGISPYNCGCNNLVVTIFYPLGCLLYCYMVKQCNKK